MNTPQYYTKEELEWIVQNSENFTVQQIALKLALGKSVIRNIGSRYKLRFKDHFLAKQEMKAVRARDPKLISDPAKEVFQRPPALYSNSSPMGIASAIRKL